jgi:hypothetical protein
VCPLCFPTHTAHPRVSFIFYYLDWPVHQLPYLLCFHFYWFAKELPLTSPSTHLPSDYLKSILSTPPNPFLLFPLCPGCPLGFRFPVWFSSGFSCCLFSVSLRMYPDAGLDHVMVSKYLLTLTTDFEFLYVFFQFYYSIC